MYVNYFIWNIKATNIFFAYAFDFYSPNQMIYFAQIPVFSNLYAHISVVHIVRTASALSKEKGGAKGSWQLSLLFLLLF